MIKKTTSILSPNSGTKTKGGCCATQRFTNLTLVGTLLLGVVAAGCTRDPASSTPASSARSVTPAPQVQTVQANAAIYKCPMHPDVTSDKPGKCSVCGMNLEKSP